MAMMGAFLSNKRRGDSRAPDGWFLNEKVNTSCERDGYARYREDYPNCFDDSLHVATSSSWVKG
jgi:hypothetical protein